MSVSRRRDGWPLILGYIHGWGPMWRERSKERAFYKKVYRPGWDFCGGGAASGLTETPDPEIYKSQWGRDSNWSGT